MVEGIETLVCVLTEDGTDPFSELLANPASIGSGRMRGDTCILWLRWDGNVLGSERPLMTTFPLETECDDNDDVRDMVAGAGEFSMKVDGPERGVWRSSKSAMKTPSSSGTGGCRRRSSCSSLLSMRTYSTASTSFRPKLASVDCCSRSRPKARRVYVCSSSRSRRDSAMSRYISICSV